MLGFAHFLTQVRSGPALRRVVAITLSATLVGSTLIAIVKRQDNASRPIPIAGGGLIVRDRAFFALTTGFAPTIGTSPKALAVRTKTNSQCGAKGPTIKQGFYIDRAYPLSAIRDGIEGKVTFQYTVGQDGTLISVGVISADPPGYFEKATEKEVRRMRFTPATNEDCQPVSSGVLTQSIVYRLY